MSVEGWVRWCRSRTARVWTINTFTHAKAAYAALLQVLAFVTPPLMGLTLVLLVGVLWSRAIRSARLVFLPTLLALFAAMMLASRVVIHALWAAHMPDPPAWIIEFSMDMGPWRRAAFLGGLWLVVLGGVALLIRAFRVHVLRTAAPIA
ncbi:hypothetical protein ACN28E_39655 [Archangium lansingense]|uniref:hypothetical protein n=1 Tax=Archangium lansingense TaxID=2995310 RepID=UPI003B80D0DD